MAISSTRHRNLLQARLKLAGGVPNRCVKGSGLDVALLTFGQESCSPSEFSSAQICRTQTRGNKKKRRMADSHAPLTNTSIFRVPQGSPPYRHSMPIPHYVSGFASYVNGGWLTLSHQPDVNLPPNQRLSRGAQYSQPLDNFLRCSVRSACICLATIAIEIKKLSAFRVKHPRH